MVQIGEVQFPRTDPEAACFFDGTRQGRIEIAVPVAFEHPFAAQPQVVTSLRALSSAWPFAEPRATRASGLRVVRR